MIIVKICLCLVVQTFHNSNGVVIPTKYGDVRGVQTDNGYAFLGVPYAAPPVGDLRYNQSLCLFKLSEM